MLALPSKLLHIRPQIQLVRPGVAGLLVQHPVSIRDVIRVEDAVLRFEGIAVGEQGADELGVDGAVDDGMGDVYAQRPQFARHALGQGTQRHLAA